ncbi:MAG TPA: metallophosphoesterase family protein [Methylomirabilota bacterium]|nr:metallophosphoesterase family protein [Methylomirabilota bacterium]
MTVAARHTKGKQQRIGLISDTHGLVRPEALEALRDSDLLIHAGDIGKPDVLAALKRIAPLIAIRGNIDTAPWAKRLTETKRMTVGTIKLYIIHNLKELEFNPAARGFRLVISGHSHKPLIATRDNVLFVNPGSAGPRRFKLPISVARLFVQGDTFDAEIIELAI